jgi:hypothetical protein
VIYFVQPEGRPFIKIGYARCVRDRLSELQAYNPEELILLGVIPGGRPQETMLHQRFAHLWVRGEWFRYTAELCSFIQEQADAYQPKVHDPSPADADKGPWKAALAKMTEPESKPVRRICVWIQRFNDRHALVLQWFDPDTGKRCSKTAGTSSWDEAEVRRADLEALLNRKMDVQFLSRNDHRNKTPKQSAGQAQSSDAKPLQDEGNV